MKKNILLFALLSSLTFNAQSLDSTFYRSNFEQLLFKKSDSFKLGEHYLEGLFAIDSALDAKYAERKRKELDDFIKSLDIQKIEKYSDKKKIKYIFKTTHDRFFNKYQDIANFNLIFKEGTYNCVSATALYSYIFEKLKIPYQIKETPSHIYLVAYPNDSNIYVETTIPGNNGFYVPSDNDMQKAVNDLITSKLITNEEVNNVGYKKAYMNFFYSKEYLLPYELIGIQYYNKAIFDFQNQDYESSYANFSKSEIFYNTKKVKYLKISSLSLLLDKSNFKNIKDIKNISTLLNDLEFKKDYLEKDVRFFVSNVITANENDEKFLINSIEIFNKNIINTEVKNIINKNFYHFIAESRFNQDKNTEDILFYALKAYELDKNNKILETLISRTILKSFFYVTPNEDNVSKLENYEKKYPFIKESIFYKKFILRIYSYMTNKYYYDKNSKVGESYFLKLKELIDIAKKENIELDQELIGGAYWAVGAYYYGKSNFKKAKSILEEGKKIAPNHHNLNKVLSYVNEDLKY